MMASQVRKGGWVEQITMERSIGLALLLAKHVLRVWPAYLVVFFSVYLFNANYEFGFNTTPSLPYKFFLIHYNEPIHRGDFIAFKWNGAYPYRKGQVFIKIAAGVAGDEVSRIGQEYFVAGKSAGVAKKVGLRGQPLAPSDTGIIGPNQFYAQAPHKDSLDSRYSMLGLVNQGDVVGRAYVIF